ncbi:alpha/beta family hydrolase [Dyella sp. KULCS107]|uniref:alpha/beta family hydrolase n=1 Tax=Dyella sp. KULCS107 TaxID=3422216 RepID=UPI003D6FAE70
MAATYTEGFVDRADAGEQLARALRIYRGQHPLVLAIPRGGVPVGRVIADALDGELDVVLVRKLGAPSNPELAIGAVDEQGRVSLSDYAAATGADEAYVARETAQQLALIRQRRHRYRPRHPPIDPAGRVVIVVDDGLATGSTMRAALAAVRARHPASLICAVPVAAPHSLVELKGQADDVVCLSAPPDFRAVGQFYQRFEAVPDEEVIELLAAAPSTKAATAMQSVQLHLDGVTLQGDLTVPPQARGVVIFAHGSGSSRLSPRSRAVAGVLHEHGLATLLFDLLSTSEDADRRMRFDIALLASRLGRAVRWAAGVPALHALPVGLFGASTGAAAALVVAAQQPERIAAVVSRGGRPDLAGTAALAKITAPTLLIVGGADTDVIMLNRQALALMQESAELVLVPRATHLFEEPGALERVAALAADWFTRWLVA